MSRFVKAETVVLPISGNETLVVKKRLNRGEEAEMYSRMRAPGDIGTRADSLRVSLERVLAYLVDWTIADEGKPVPYRDLVLSPGKPDLDARTAILNNLDPDDFKEIRDAIDRHEAAVEAAREAEKKAQRGEPPSSPNSTSVDGSDSRSAVPTNSNSTSETSA